jgi:pyridoxamine 5'-phosphate oxidase
MSAVMRLADLRTDYTRARLDEDSALADPSAQLRRWLDEAIAASVDEPTAMTIATVDREHQPHARIVLLKDLDARGLTFFTNYESDKGAELAVNARAAALLFWQPLQRQARVEGRVERVSASESDTYFASRPRESQLGAWASDQSAEIASRALLEEKLALVATRFAGVVPRPAHWGGYRLVPTRFEFWQGRASRLHDRLRYDAIDDSGSWTRTRRSP